MIKKNGSFTRNMRKLEGRELDLPIVDCTLPGSYDHYLLMDMIDMILDEQLVGDEFDFEGILTEAFTWSTTKQGQDYWSSLYNHERNLTEEDFEIFKNWREQLADMHL